MKVSLHAFQHMKVFVKFVSTRIPYFTKIETFFSNFSNIKYGRDIWIHKSLEIRNVACQCKIWYFNFFQFFFCCHLCTFYGHRVVKGGVENKCVKNLNKILCEYLSSRKYLVLVVWDLLTNKYSALVSDQQNNKWTGIRWITWR